ncbi:inner nuclear membrane protein enriched at telomere/subtelomere region [Coemansia javaensis]|uniref:Inner nuclear membrane protein enriched at telomere/subtelomere region n=1 Tax=Coemansia javaensis TaxID=2761396 RepID=A0A9W8HAE8_9FUNG|nr:inner nuclear membrane protein enriched at telomere/subtelomere region [Coemansia javaensis]
MSAIRGILHKHDVEYPSNAKKSELLGLLQSRVLKHAPRLRREARRSVKGDGRDIEVVVGKSAQAQLGAEAAAAAEAEAGAEAGAGPRTRSQTPRTERMRKPVLAAQDKKTAREEDKKTAREEDDKKAKDDDKKAADEPSDRPRKKKRAKRPKALKRAEATAAAAEQQSQEPAAAADHGVGRAADVKRAAGTKRKLSDAEEERSAGSGDEAAFTPARIARQPQPQPQQHGERAAGNFSDDNPFQSSPETARKRRRKASADARAATPMAALRKSQVSELSFKVALPRQRGSDAGSSPPRPEPESEPAPAPGRDQAAAEPDQDQDQDVDMLPADSPSLRAAAGAGPQLLSPAPERRRVGDLVAQYQGQPPPAHPRSPTVRIRDELARPPPPPFSVHPAPAGAARFTMTPDALRQLAAERQGERPRMAGAPPRERIASRASGAGAGSAPGPAELFPPIEQTAHDAHDLQRRRVATLRQHAEASGADGDSRARRHSRQSSIASIAPSVGEARGVPSVPAAASGAKADGDGRRAAAAGRLAWLAWLAWLALLLAAGAAWRAHQRFATGFGSARSDYAPLAAPAVRARYLQPPPLECPAHADCVPYTPLPAAWPAATGDDDSAAARDRWVVTVVDRAAAAGTRNERRVAVVQCDAGHVLQFPALASRVYPLPPRCVRDEPTEQRVRQLVAAMVRECAAKRGAAQCEMTLLEQARDLLGRSSRRSSRAEAEAEGAGDDVDADDADAEDADEIERLGLSAPELRRAMWLRKSPRLTDAEFDAVFRLAAAELDARPDLVASYLLAAADDDDDNGDGDGSGVTYYVARAAAHPPLCRLRRAVLRLVLGNVAALAAALAAAVLAFVASRRYAAARAEAAAADALVGSALARLKRQARRHYLDPALSPSTAIPSLQLRDLLLLLSSSPQSATPLPGFMTPPPPPRSGRPAPAVAYYDPRARSSVWERVRRVVERNANVRCRTTTVRGEPMRVWEWIGPLDDDDEDTAMFSPFASPVAAD